MTVMNKAQIIERLVDRDVLVNASQMIDALSRNATPDGDLVDFDEMLGCQTAPDYSEPPDGYEVHRDAQTGVYVLLAYREDSDSEDHRDEIEDGFDTKREAIIAAWEDSGDEPDDTEALEHWIVTNYLADKLEEVGALVSRDVLGFNIWGRSESGQALHYDSDLIAIAESILSAE